MQLLRRDRDNLIDSIQRSIKKAIDIKKSNKEKEIYVLKNIKMLLNRLHMQYFVFLKKFK